MFDRIKRIVEWYRNIGKWHRTTKDRVFEINYEAEHGVSVTHYIAQVSVHEKTGEKETSYVDAVTTFYTNSEWSIATQFSDESDYSTTICHGENSHSFPKEEYEEQL